jgi:hypothetical protein
MRREPVRWVTYGRWRRALLLSLTASASFAQAAVIRVDPSGRGDFTALQAAIDAAAAGDVVLAAPGEYVIDEPLSFRGKAIELRSEEGPRMTSIRRARGAGGLERGSVLVFENGEPRAAILDGFTVLGGSSEFGGGISIAGASPTVRRCIIRENQADFRGGAVSVRGGSPSFSDCTFERNAADYGGAIDLVDSRGATFVNCAIAGNVALLEGGGFYILRLRPRARELHRLGQCRSLLPAERPAMWMERGRWTSSMR